MAATWPTFELPVTPPVDPMLAKLSRDLVEGDLLYEPKWDGFRVLVFRDGDQIELQSRNKKPLARYFPEILDPLRAALPDRCVLDGELVVPVDGGLDFDAISQRIHPAASRIELLSEQTPAHYVAFDLLALADESLMDAPMERRRRRLEEMLAGARPPVHVTPATRDVDTAADWFERFEGAGFDGVIAKPLDAPYAPGKRTLMKIKHERTADCVVAGFRWHKDGEGVGSLLLGLYDNRGELHHIGVATSFSAKRRSELVEELAPYREDALGGHPWADWAETTDSPRGGHRWNATKDMSWEPLRLGLVAEVAYGHLQGDRLRHSGKLVRWRPDKDPADCTYDQLDTPAPAELREVFAAG